MKDRKQRLLRSAEKHVSRGRYQAAVDDYKKLLKQSPNDTTTLNRVGDLYVRMDQLDKAIQLFKRTAEHFSREGFFVKAIAIYKKIVRLDPTRIDVYERLADLHTSQGLTSEAVGQYQVVVDYHLQQKATGAAVAVLEKMVEAEPSNPAAQLQLAEICEEAGDIDAAVGHFVKIAEVLAEFKRPDESVEAYRRAIELNPQDLELIGQAVGSLQQAGHYGAAQKVLAAAEALNPSAATVLEEGGVPAAAPAPAEEPEVPATDPMIEHATDPSIEVPTADEVFLDLDDPDLNVDFDRVLASPESKPEPLPKSEAEPERAEEYDIDLASLEASVTPVPEQLEAALDEGDVTRNERAEELFAEAAVLGRYGLEEQAEERIAELVAMDLPDARSWSRLAMLCLDVSSSATVSVAERARAADEEGGYWPAVEKRLLQDGYEVTDRAVRAPGGEADAPEAPDEVAATPAAKTAPPPDLEPDVPTSIPVEGFLDEEEAEPSPEPAPAPAEGEVTLADWLDDAAARRQEMDKASAFAGTEEDFFDLAGELEAELSAEGVVPEDAIISGTGEEQTLEEIIAGFKKGMEQTLSEEDYDTHFNLGIAYQEMGLVDEAIGEFQIAAKHDRYLIECCSLLAGCFVEKGFSELAAKWYHRGLDAPDVTDEQTQGFLYELGCLELATGEHERARERFVELYGINSNYRDVVAKLEELGTR